MDHVHLKARSSSKSNPSKMACEKASRRLRSVLVKASRVGVSTAEVANLPSAKKLIPQRDHGWKLAVFLILMFGGGVIVALVCTARKGCSRIEDIQDLPVDGRLRLDERRFQLEDSRRRREAEGGYGPAGSARASC